ncbi:MAG: NAD(P)H-dependent glycerol-3-phosphate dehydrogenase [Vampirovibrionales bacterium]
MSFISDTSPLLPQRSSPSKITILGAGSWGLTLSFIAGALHGCDASVKVTLWDRTPSKLAAFEEQQRSIQKPIALQLQPHIILESDLTQAVADTDILIFVVTSKATREVALAVQATGQLKPDCVLVNASKGIEYPSLKPMSRVLKEIFPSNPVAVLSGPTLAQEIVEGKPTACTVASDSLAISQWLQTYLSCSSLFRLYTHTDMLGVELAGALKNVFAIASGFMVSKNLGDNARAALLTRGLAEMARFCIHLGAEDSTLYGLSGLGDLLATCNSPLSRNYQVGYRLGQGEQLPSILASMGQVAEGVHTVNAVVTLAESKGIDMPIASLVKSVIDGKLVDAPHMIAVLMNRKLKQES